MTTQLATPSRASSAARWRKPQAITSIVTIALISGVMGNGWARQAAAGTPPVHDLAVVPIDEGFETEDTIFTYFTQCTLCEGLFHPVTSDAHTGSQSLFAPDSAAAGSTTASGPTVIIPENAVAAELTFWQRFEFEHGGVASYDGGVLELQTGDAESPWVDAGPHITAGGYTGSIIVRGAGNPLEGRAAWVGASDGWQQVTVDLLASRGQRLAFRLQIGTDPSNATPVGGWWVDDFRVTYRAPASACSRDWNPLPPRPGIVGYSAVASVGADLYVFGGRAGSLTNAAAYRYSTQNDSWNPRASLPEARFGASAVSDGRYIYILGGYGLGKGPPTANLWRYDPVANSYLTLAPLKTPTAFHAAVYLDGTIYKIGGTTDEIATTLTTAVEAYSIADNAWSTVADYPEATRGLAAETIDRYIYTVAGLNSIGATTKAYRYDPASNTWDDGPIADSPLPASLASGIFYHGTWLVSADDAFIGWDPRTNIWRSLDRPPQRVVLAEFSVIGDAAYIFGVVPGSEDTALLQYVEENCACLGDCDGDGMVSISELVKGVGIALQLQPVNACMAFDGNGNGKVAVNELVTAVGNALRACGGG